MTRLARALVIAALLAGAYGGPRAFAGEPGTRWESWDKAAFARAEREGRHLLLQVSASWCHWCHVMERETFADPRVERRIAAGWVAIRVDADARPDLAERFAAYRWPATILLTAKGDTLAAIRGYRGPDDFLAILDEVEKAAREGRTVEARWPEGKVASTSPDDAFLRDTRARLERVVSEAWDPAGAGWTQGQKYPHAAPVEHALREARWSGDPAWRAQALSALAAYERLLDPVWGGMYQYSEGGVWTRPHYEKIASVNAGALSAFAAAFRATGDPRWRRDAEEIRRYLVAFWRGPSGAFATSQDADVGSHGDGPFVAGADYFGKDDAGRRRLGMPRIDPAVYAAENARIVRALVDLHAATGDPAPLEEARAAYAAIRATHRGDDGGWRHAASDAAATHLVDSVAAGHASLALFEATGEPERLADAVAVARFLGATLRDPRGGFLLRTKDDAPGALGRPLRPIEGNVAAARFLLALHATTEAPEPRREALLALRAAADPQAIERWPMLGASLLLAVEEASFPWTRVTVVGERGAADEAALWRAALALDTPLAVRERLAPGAPTSGSGTIYPLAAWAAAYVCADGRCSPPVRDPARLAATVAALRRGP